MKHLFRRHEYRAHRRTRRISPAQAALWPRLHRLRGGLEEMLGTPMRLSLAAARNKFSVLYLNKKFDS